MPGTPQYTSVWIRVYSPMANKTNGQIPFAWSATSFQSEHDAVVRENFIAKHFICDIVATSFICVCK